MLGASMPSIARILLRILGGIAGTLLLYVAFFLYEDEEAGIQISSRLAALTAAVCRSIFSRAALAAAASDICAISCFAGTGLFF